MIHLPPINPRPEQGREHHTQERFARDEMLAILRVGTPAPLRDLPVDGSRVVVLPNPINVYIDPSQPRVEYQLCEMTETLVTETESVDGNWELAEMLSPELNERKSFALRAGRNWCRNDLTGIFMQDNRRGWIRGDGIVLYTDDGGSHWRILASGRELHHLPRQRTEPTTTHNQGPEIGNSLNTDWQFQDAIEAAPWRPAQAPAANLVWSLDNRGVQSIGDIQINALQSIENIDAGESVVVEEWAVGDEGHIFYRKNGGDWLPQQSFVFLHDRVNVRLGIDTSLDVSWLKNTPDTHELIVPFHADYPAVYMHRSQLKVRYRLMAARETTATVLSGWVEGTGDTIQIPFAELPPLEEDLTVYIWAESFDVPIIHEEWMEAVLQLYVQPDPRVKVTLVSRIIDYGARPEIGLNGVQSSVTYHLHAYIPPYGEYLPDEPISPEFAETEHPQLAESYYLRATILRQLRCYEEAGTFASAAVALHEEITYPLDPSRIVQYQEEQAWNRQALASPDHESPAYYLETPFATIPHGFKVYVERSGSEATEQELTLLSREGWQEDSYFLIEAKKTTGKGGSIWLDPLLLLRVRPRIDDLELRLLGGEAANWQAPLAVQIRNAQFGVGYQLIDPEGERPAILPLEDAEWAIGWWLEEHLFGRKVGFNFIVGEPPYQDPDRELNAVQRAAGTAAGSRALGWPGYDKFFGMRVGVDYVVGEWEPNQPPAPWPWSHLDKFVQEIIRHGRNRYFKMQIGKNFIIGKVSEQDQPILDSVVLLSGSVPTERSVAMIRAVKAYSGLSATTRYSLDPPGYGDEEE